GFHAWRQAPNFKNIVETIPRFRKSHKLALGSLWRLDIFLIDSLSGLDNTFQQQ
ncbi:hypothetical protein AMECASPLE_032470, partial [Ameca splendens]